MEDRGCDQRSDNSALQDVRSLGEPEQMEVGITVPRDRILTLIRENEEYKHQLVKLTAEYEDINMQRAELKHTIKKMDLEKKALELKLQETESRTQELLYERSEIACSESIITELRNEIEELLIQISSIHQNYSMKYLDFKSSEYQNKRAISQLQESLSKYKGSALKLISVLQSKSQIDSTNPAITKVIAESKDTDSLRGQILQLQNEVEFFKSSAKENEVKIASLHSRLLDRNARLVQLNSLLKQSARLRSFDKQTELNRLIPNTNEILQKNEDLPKRSSYVSSTSYGYHSSADSGEVRSHDRLSQDLHNLYERNGYDLPERVNEDYSYYPREQIQHPSMRSNTSSNNSVTTMIASPYPNEYQGSIDQSIRRIKPRIQ